MTEGDFPLRTRDGTELAATLFARDRPRGALVVAHGVGEHRGRYRELAEALSDYDVLTYDMRGHGESPGRRGYVRRWRVFVDDLIDAIDRMAGRSGRSLPTFVLGHSNGGLVALAAALETKRPLAGLILSSPAFRVIHGAPRWKRALGRLLLWFAPRVTLKTAMRVEALTADPDRQASFRGDRLTHDRISAPVYFGMVAAGSRLSGKLGAVGIPLLGLAGDADPVIDPLHTRALFGPEIPGSRTFWPLPGIRHEPFHDVERAALVGRIKRWLDALAPGPS